MPDEVFAGAEGWYRAGFGHGENSYGDPGFLGHDHHFGDVTVSLPKAPFVKIWRKHGESLRALLGAGPPLRVHNGSGWIEIPRPKRDPIIEWVGGEVDRLSLPILLNGFRRRQSIEPQINSLLDWYGDGNSQPAVIHVAFPGNKPTNWKRRWVIENLEWGELVEWDRQGHRRLRQDVVVSLMARGDEDLISPAKRRHRDHYTNRGHNHLGPHQFPGGPPVSDSSGGVGPSDVGIPGPLLAIHVARQGDTLQRLAVIYFSDAGEWLYIRRRNPDLPRDPDRQIPVGTKVKIPES